MKVAEVREGMAFGHLVVLDLLDDEPRIDGDLLCRVRCKCGLRYRVRVRHLVSGESQSCGCRGRPQFRMARRSA